jgi:dTDP-4-dehydrorhamnose reductase
VAFIAFIEARRPEMERLLVTGVDYPLGANLALTLSDRCDVLGLYGRHAVESPGVSTTAWDGLDLDTIGEVVADWRPQWMIHCGPLSSPGWDEAIPQGESHEQAVVAQLAQMATESGLRLTVLSSDAVFAGPRMFHEETSPAESPSPRAAHIRAMERALVNSRALVARTHAYGWSPVAAHAGFAELAAESLAAGRPVCCDGRRYATPILASDLAELLWRAYELRLEGLYHMAGAERASANRFVCELAASLGLPAVSGRTTPDDAPAVLDETSLNSKRARRMLQMPTPLVREGLNRFVEQAEGGWRERWQTASGRPRQHETAA